MDVIHDFALANGGKHIAAPDVRGHDSGCCAA
jgi:hypothetical protein